MSDFYNRNAALYEEFQRKEQHFLNTEKSLNSFLLTKASSSASLQEYLHKINLRERKTEAAYKNVMRQMEDMDRRTDDMFYNIEKLRVLKTTMLDSQLSTLQNIQERIETPLPPYAVVPSSLNFGHNFENSNVSKQNSCVQTEDLFCDQCHFPLHHSSYGQKNANTFYESSIEKTSVDKGTYPKSSTPHFDIADHAYALTQSVSAVLGHKIDSGAILDTSDPLKTEYGSGKQNFNLERKVDIPPESISASSPLADETINPNNIEVPPVEDVLRDDIGQTEDENSRPLNAFVQDEATLNESNVGTKSDDESMNHEFNFLESEKSTESDKLGEDVQNYKSKNNQRQSDAGAHAGLSETFTVEKKKDISPDNGTAMTKISTDKISHLDVRTDDLRSESSMSAAGLQSPLHSEPASVESDLDDFFDKETPATDTPAYQALLGNITLMSKAPKKQVPSDSESEDSVEKALSNALKKPSSSTPKSPPEVQKKDPQKEMPSKEINNDKKRSSTASDVRNKTQADLLRSRRKVLLFDSSGSEMEPEVRPAKQNTAEDDDDEFDF